MSSFGLRVIWWIVFRGFFGYGMDSAFIKFVEIVSSGRVVEGK